MKTEVLVLFWFFLSFLTNLKDGFVEINEYHSAAISLLFSTRYSKGVSTTVFVWQELKGRQESGKVL